MCSNPDTYEFRLSLDLPQQSAVPTDTFSALREVHEYSAENCPRFHTAEYLQLSRPPLLPKKASGGPVQGH